MNDNSTKLPNFSGGFHRFEVTLSTNREKSTKDVLLVLSSGKREAVTEYLWLKFVNSQLSKSEYELFIALLNEKDEKKWAFLRLLTTNLSKSILRKRLISIETLIGEKPSNQTRLQGYYRLRIEIRKEIRRLPKVKPFSGYIKSPSTAGSKRSLVRQLDEMVAHDDSLLQDNSFSWYSLLSVGNVPLLGREVNVP